MLLVLPLVAGLLIGKLTGGTFKALSTAPLRGAVLFLGGFAIQIVLYNPWTQSQSWDIRYGHVLYVVSLVMLLAGLTINMGRLRWPLVVLTAGAALNVIVIVANAGAMPVDAHLLAEAKGSHLVWLIAHHHLASNVAPATAGTRLPFLDDHLAAGSTVASIGDVLIGVGGLVLVALEMHRSPQISPAHDTGARNDGLSSPEAVAS